METVGTIRIRPLRNSWTLIGIILRQGRNLRVRLNLGVIAARMVLVPMPFTARLKIRMSYRVIALI